MVRSAWLKAQKRLWTHSKDLGPSRSLENRIVLCADCDSNRTLALSASGELVCSSCGSQNWMFASTSIVAHLKNCEAPRGLRSCTGSSSAASPAASAKEKVV